MSTRFHSKFHRHNHHTDPSPDPRFPDSSYDPIASPDSPFLGAFVLSGSLIANSPLSAYTAYIRNENDTALYLDGANLALSANGGTIVKNITCENIVINNLFTVFSSINFTTDVGIGGNLYLSGSLFVDGDTFLGGNTFFVSSTSYFVGINTTDPNHELTVNGNISSTHGLYVEDGIYSGNYFIADPSVLYTTVPLDLQNSANITGNVNLSSDLNVAKNTHLYQDLRVGPVPSPFLFVNSTNARVGIRTATPNVEFTVNGEVSATRSLYVGENLAVNRSTLFVVASNDRVGINTRSPNKDLTVVGEISSTSQVNLGNDTLFVDSINKRVGINTLVPNVPFTIVGSVSGTDNVVFDTSLSAGNTFFVDSINKRVGINTTQPNHTLTVVGRISATELITAPTLSLSTLSVHPSSLPLTGLVTSLTSVTASDEFIVLDINGKRRALRLWDF